MHASYNNILAHHVFLHSLAHSALEQHQEACDCFRQALRLEPNNEMYKTNLLQSEQKLKDAATSAVSSFYWYCTFYNCF